MRAAFLLAVGLVGFETARASSAGSAFKVNPLHIDLSKEVPRMLDMINNTRLPDEPEYPGLGSSMGIDLDVLKSLRKEWLHGFDWDTEQKHMNRSVVISTSRSCLSGLNDPGFTTIPRRLRA